jgi:integrase
MRGLLLGRRGEFNQPSRTSETPGLGIQYLKRPAAAKKLGLPGVTLHLLRHSHATMLDSVATPIGTMPSLLGPSTPEITREIYLQAIPEEQRRAVESVERLVLDPLGPKFRLRRRPRQAE